MPEQRAGATTVGKVEIENAGTAAWRSRPGRDIHLSYHWLDRLGNPIVWAGAFILLPSRVDPGQRITVFVTVRAPIPPGAYRLAFDLVNEGRFWFHELGNTRLELDVDVLPRIARRAVAVVVAPGAEDLVELTRRALEAQTEPVTVSDAEATAYLAAGCQPAADWAARVLDAHAEGFVAVGGAIDIIGGPIDRRRAPRELDAWRPGFGRAPAWNRPLLCPSLLADANTRTGTGPAGLPAVDPTTVGGPFICDGRIRVAVAARALRRAGRPAV